MRDRKLDARTRRGDARRAIIVEAMLQAAREGNFRPSLVYLKARTGFAKTSVLRLFGSLDLLYRVIAREHAEAVCHALRRVSRNGALAPANDSRTLAWLVMVGTAPEAP